jgi:hypothetical protein
MKTTLPKTGSAQLLPVYLEDTLQAAFARQLDILVGHAGDLVEWLPPVHISHAPGLSADAVIVPDMSGVAYRRLDEFRRVELPILVITSEFGAVSMWDWEIRDYLRRRGVETVAPTSLQEYHDICRALAMKKTLRNSTMLAYLDSLGAGQQPDIFKRFYWWEEECDDDLQNSFGVTVDRRSYKYLWARALSIPAVRVDDEMARISGPVPMATLTNRARRDAVRLKLALSDELDETPNVIAAGINCHNESTT